MIYDKECEEDENKIWIKDEVEPQQISNHTRSYSVVSHTKMKTPNKEKENKDILLFE